MQWKWSRKKARWDNNQPVWSSAWIAKWITAFPNFKDILGLPHILWEPFFICCRNGNFLVLDKFGVNRVQINYRFTPHVYQNFSVFLEIHLFLIFINSLPLSSRWVPHVSCGRTKPDSSLLKGTILRSTQLYAEYPGVLVYKICTSISCSQKRSTATSRVFGYLGFSSTPPSVAMIGIGLSIEFLSSMCFLKSRYWRAFLKSISCVRALLVSCFILLTPL